MANDLMSKESIFMVNGEEVKLTGNIVKNYLTRGNKAVSEQEIVLFMNLCKFQKLNPFLNEAYLVKFNDAPAQLITSKAAYMKKAESNPNYDGFKAGLIIQRKEEIIEIEGGFTLKGDILLGAWAQVFRKDRKHPYTIKVGLDEYDKGQSTWKSMPKTMIRKVAIVNALREAFPADTNGLYVEEEKIETDQINPEKEIKENANKELLEFSQESKETIVDVEYKETEKEGQQVTIEPEF